MLLALSLLACGEKETTDTVADTDIDTGDTATEHDTGTGDTGEVACALLDVNPKTIAADYETDVLVTSLCGDVEAQETVTLQVGYSEDILSQQTPAGVDFTVAIHHHGSTLTRDHKPLTLVKRIDKSSPLLASGGTITGLSEDLSTVLAFKTDGTEVGSRSLDSEHPCVTGEGLCWPVEGGYIGFDGSTATDATVNQDFAEWAEAFDDNVLFVKVKDVVVIDALRTDEGITVLGSGTDGGHPMFWVVRTDGSYTTASTIGEMSPEGVAAGKGAVSLAPYDSTTTGFDTGVVVSAFVIGGGGTQVVAHDFSVYNLNKSSGKLSVDLAIETADAVRFRVDGDDHVVLWESGGSTVVMRRDAKRLGLDTAEVEMLRPTVGGGHVMAAGSAVRMDGAGSLPIANPWTSTEDPVLVLGSDIWMTAGAMGTLPGEGDIWNAATRDGETAGWGIESDGGGAGVYAKNKYPENMQHKEREHISFTYQSVVMTPGQPITTTVNRQSLFVEDEKYFLQSDDGETRTELDLDFENALAVEDDGGWFVHGIGNDGSPQLVFVDTTGKVAAQTMELSLKSPRTVVVGDFLGTGEDMVLWIGDDGTEMVTPDGKKNRRTEFTVLSFEHQPSRYVADVNGDGMDDVLVHDGLHESMLLLSDGDGGWLDEEHSLELTGLAWPGPVPGYAQEGPLLESTTMWGL